MEKYTDRNGIVLYRSPKLAPLRHGFSTRLGGVSRLPHTSQMNLGFSRGDDDKVVLHNLELFCRAVKIDPHTAVSLPQIHSTNIIYAGADLRGAGFYLPPPCECDGYVTDCPDVAVGVKTADCVPILLADTSAGVVCALHAGWRGTVNEITIRGVEHMCALGARRKRITAAIGPSIGQCCYEVGEDVAGPIKSKLGGSPDAGYLIPSEKSGKYYANLSAFNAYLLRTCGVAEENIDAADICTCCGHEMFHSHRATGGVRGTMLALISL